MLSSLSPSSRSSPVSSSRSLFTLLVLPAILFTSQATAQVGTILDQSKLPDCVLSCKPLLDAQTVCVPPSAPTTNQATYQSCFCTSGYLATFKTTLYDLCGGSCSVDQLSTVKNWYTSLCRTGGPVVTPGLQQDAAAATSTVASGTAATSSAAAPTYYAVNGDGRPWISSHYQWVIFVAVLAIAAGLAIWGGLWYKKRHRRKAAAASREATLAAEEAANSIRPRHPDGSVRDSLRGGMVQVPGWDGSVRSQGRASRGSLRGLGMVPSSEMLANEYAEGRGGGKASQRTTMSEVKDLGLGGDGITSVPSSSWSNTGRTPSFHAR